MALNDVGSSTANIGGAPSAGTDWAKVFNPATIQMMLAFSSALDPKGFGGNLAAGLKPIAGNMAVAQGAVPAGQPKPVAGTTVAGDPLTDAKHLSTLSSMMKKGFEVRPDLIPSGYIDGLTGALKATPPPLQNPTTPAAAASPEPVAAGAPQQVQTQQPVAPPPVDYSNLAIDPTIAGGMSPDQLQSIFANRNAIRTTAVAERGAAVEEAKVPIAQLAAEAAMKGATAQESNAATNARQADYADRMEAVDRALKISQTGNFAADAGYKNWQRTPEGIKAAMDISSASANAQVAGEKMKIAYRLDEFRKLPPAILNAKIGGTGLTAGQLGELDIISGAAPSIASIINADERAKATQAYYAYIGQMRKDAAGKVKADAFDKANNYLNQRIEKLLGKVSAKSFNLNDPNQAAAYQAALAFGNIRPEDGDKQLERLMQEKKQLFEKYGVPFVAEPISSDAPGVIEYERGPDGKLRVKGADAVPNPQAESIFQNMFNPTAVPGL